MTDTMQQKQLRVTWADDEEVEVGSAAELDECLDRLDAQARAGEPFIASLVHPDGPMLSIALGADRSSLNYMASMDPPYFTSHNPDGDPDETLAWYYFGAESEFNGDQVVPMEQAREAVRRFLADGRRPENIDWRED